MSRSSWTFGVSARLRRLQAADDLLVVALGRQRRDGAERGAHVAQRALAGLQREIGRAASGSSRADQLLEPRQRFAALTLIVFVRRRVACRELRVGFRVSRRHVGIGRNRRAPSRSIRAG